MWSTTNQPRNIPDSLAITSKLVGKYRLKSQVQS